MSCNDANRRLELHMSDYFIIPARRLVPGLCRLVRSLLSTVGLLQVDLVLFRQVPMPHERQPNECSWTVLDGCNDDWVKAYNDLLR